MRRKTTIFLFTLTLLLMAAAVAFMQVQWEDFPLAVVVEAEGGSEKISCWKGAGDTYYVFLPGYADRSQVRLRTNRFYPVFAEGQRLKDGMSCEDFPLDAPLNLTYTSGGKTHERTLIFSQSGNVAAMYLDVVSGSIDYVNQNKDHSEPGSLRIYTYEGKLDSAGGVETVSGRGNSTWEAEKKPYGLKLANQQNLLGMGAAKEWILLANAFDRSHIRNKMAYDFAKAAQAAYTPEGQWVDLYVNGEYLGLYLLTERNEVHPQRVAISEEGSFLVSLEWSSRLQWQQFPSITSDRGNFLRIQYAGMAEDEVLNIWQSAENSIYAEDGIDPITGKHWQELIDVDSWAEQFLLREVFADADAAAMSQFFYYSEDAGKLFAGPIWDMDNILNCWNTQPVNVITAGRQHVWGPEQDSVFYALYQKDTFRERMLQLYHRKFVPLLRNLLTGGIDGYTDLVTPAAAMDSLRWDKTYSDGNARDMREYLKCRMDFLEDFWTSGQDYCILETADEVQWRSYAVRRGDNAEFFRIFENAQWFAYGTDEPFDLSEPVNQDRVIWMQELETFDQ